MKRMKRWKYNCWDKHLCFFGPMAVGVSGGICLSHHPHSIGMIMAVGFIAISACVYGSVLNGASK